MGTAGGLGVTATGDLVFGEHVGRMAASGKVVVGMLLRTFGAGEGEPMIRMFGSYIGSKLECCGVVWSPSVKKGMNDIENIQRAFTGGVEGVEELNYHQRLKELKMYSMERRRERYMIIYGYQQLEGIKENVLLVFGGSSVLL